MRSYLTFIILSIQRGVLISIDLRKAHNLSFP